MVSTLMKVSDCRWSSVLNVLMFGAGVVDIQCELFLLYSGKVLAAEMTEAL